VQQAVIGRPVTTIGRPQQVGPTKLPISHSATFPLRVCQARRYSQGIPLSTEAAEHKTVKIVTSVRTSAYP
jgi:hypothetical protein